MLFIGHNTLYSYRLLCTDILWVKKSCILLKFAMLVS